MINEGRERNCDKWEEKEREGERGKRIKKKKNFGINNDGIKECKWI